MKVALAPIWCNVKAALVASSSLCGRARRRRRQAASSVLRRYNEPEHLNPEFEPLDSQDTSKGVARGRWRNGSSGNEYIRNLSVLGRGLGLGFGIWDLGFGGLVSVCICVCWSAPVACVPKNSSIRAPVSHLCGTSLKAVKAFSPHPGFMSLMRYKSEGGIKS